MGGAQQRAVLALLVIEAPDPVSVDRLVDELWGERPPASAQHTVQVYVSGLRKLLRAGGEGVAVRNSPAGYVLEVDPEQVDAKRFERLLGEGQQAAGSDPAAAVGLFEQALGLWRGRPLAGLEEFEFARREAERLEELRAVTVEALAGTRLGVGQPAEVIGQLTGLVADDPLREGPRRLLMLALYRLGRHAEALAQYREAAQALDEIGLQPSPELRQLEEAILRHDESLGGRGLMADALAGLVDGGSNGSSTAGPAGPAQVAVGRQEQVDLPGGVVTLLMSDVEGSTRLVRELGEGYGGLLADHHRLLRAVWVGHEGVEFGVAGDAFFVAFRDPGEAVRAAVAGQKVLAGHEWPAGGQVRVRMGLHTGTPRVRDGDYWGVDVHYAARLCAAAHGGQVLVSESTAALVDVELEDLGHHALRDFPSARRVFHLPIEGRSSDCFPPPRTLRAVRTSLPDQLSSFIGRGQELADLERLSADARLVTLIGTGGVGKTRLALRLATELLDRTPDGVWWVDLAPVVDPSLVGSTVAQAVNVPLRAGQPVLDTLAEALGDRAALLVLDNCEHVIDPVATLVFALLKRCPNISVLTTSREALQVAGEHLYRVPSLAAPSEDAVDPDRVAASEAVRLFVARAAEQRPGFALDPDTAGIVARVCRRLDGIPLALELAAVRLRSLSITELEARLDRRFTLLRAGSRTAPPRQQTLLALTDWSFDLLSPVERKVLARLSVFAPSGFDLEAAEAVCAGAVGEPEEVLEHLDRLVTKSLVQADDSSGTIRYRLLESIREYAAAKLAEQDERELLTAQAAHRDHYLSLAETLRPHLIGADPAKSRARLALEHDNFRAALARCLNTPDPNPGLRLATALSEFWLTSGHGAEGANWLTQQLRRPEAQEPTPTRGYALQAASWLAVEVVGDYTAARSQAEEALEIANTNHDNRLAALALFAIGWVYLRQGEFTRALELNDQALALARPLDAPFVLAELTAQRGILLANLGRDRRAAFGEALATARKAGNGSQTAIILDNIGYFELISGDLSDARIHIEEAVDIFREVDDLACCAAAKINLGLVCCVERDQHTAAQLFRAALRAGSQSGGSELTA